MKFASVIEILLREETSIARVKSEYETVTVSKFSPFPPYRFCYLFDERRRSELHATKKYTNEGTHTIYIYSSIHRRTRYSANKSND